MKKFMSLILSAVVLISTIQIGMQAAENSSIDLNVLFDKRADLICQGKYDELAELDEQLRALGVEKLTTGEVAAKFPAGTTSPLSGANQLDPQVATPSSTNVDWFSSRTNYTYNNVRYEIQTLIAQPNESNSVLKSTGVKALSSTYNWKAGFMNLVSVAASTAASKINSLAVTVFEAVKAFATGISKETVITSAEAAYTYSNVTTVSFKYVKVSGKTDDAQILSYISSKTETAVGYQFPKFIYGGNTVRPNIISGTRSLYSTPSGYNSDYNAVVAYANPSASRRNFVDHVTITGIETKMVSNIPCPCPEYPMALI